MHKWIAILLLLTLTGIACLISNPVAAEEAAQAAVGYVGRANLLSVNPLPGTTKVSPDTEIWMIYRMMYKETTNPKDPDNPIRSGQLLPLVEVAALKEGVPSPTYLTSTPKIISEEVVREIPEFTKLPPLKEGEQFVLLLLTLPEPEEGSPPPSLLQSEKYRVTLKVEKPMKNESGVEELKKVTIYSWDFTTTE